MLQITIPASEQWDPINECFIDTKAQTLQLEHSLVSISKWEMKWHKPFLGRDEKTQEETLDYVRCMTLTQNVDPSVYRNLNNQHMTEIGQYIENPMTATWFRESKNRKSSREIVTSEVIYYWMIALNIPFECQKWHLNRLLTLIRVCNEKNAPQKKMSKRQLMNRNRALNEARKKQWHSNG